MKVTRELKAKVERIFKEKRAEVYAEADAATNAAAQNAKNNLVQQITNACEAFPDLGVAIKHVVRNNSHYGRPKDIPITSEEVASYFCARGLTDPDGSINAKMRAGIAALEKQEENLLISVAYAEDMGSLQAIFANAGIEW